MPDSLTREQKRLRGQMAAHTRWAKKPDRAKATQAARDGLLRRFEDVVDPDRTLDPDERRIRAEHARKAHMKRMAFNSARARRKARRPPVGPNEERRPVAGAASETEVWATAVRVDSSRPFRRTSCAAGACPDCHDLAACDRRHQWLRPVDYPSLFGRVA